MKLFHPNAPSFLLLIMILAASVAGCQNEVSLQNGTKLVWIDSGMYSVLCEGSGWEILPPADTGGISTVSTLARISETQLIAGTCTDPMRPGWLQYFVVGGCDEVHVFAAMGELERFLPERGLTVPTKDHYLTAAQMRRGRKLP
jgi:hypothetical protein